MIHICNDVMCVDGGLDRGQTPINGRHGTIHVHISHLCLSGCVVEEKDICIALAGCESKSTQKGDCLTTGVIYSERTHAIIHR